jgi:UDP-N-acetylmuramoyl-tripeptide--D-alanyl-D-alanine ligase
VVVPNVLAALQSLAAGIWSEGASDGMKTVCITGSNGKTTTKELCAAMWRLCGTVHATTGNLNNHIGVPLTLCALPQHVDTLVLEMGCSGPNEIEELVRFAPGAQRVITSIGEAHLEKLIDLDGVRRAKLEILEESSKKMQAILSDQVLSSDPVVRRRLSAFLGKTYFVGTDEEADVRVEMSQGDSVGDALVDISGSVWQGSLRVPMRGLHQAFNVATALTSVTLAGGKPSPQQIEQVVRSLELPGGRWRIERRGPFRFVDDAYNANPTSVRASLAAFLAESGQTGARLAVIGEMLELGSEAERYHCDLARDAGLMSGLDAIIFVGRYAEEMCKAARKAGFRDCSAVKTPVDAVGVIESFNEATVLLKASRGVRLESILDEFERGGELDARDH